MNDIIKILVNPNYNSVYIVGDIHGSYSLLMQELYLKNFDFDNDLLICTGDIIDRGTENLECISLLDQKWFLTVRGNHEEMCIRGQYDPKMKDMHARNGGAWFYRQFQKTQQKIIDRLVDLPLVIEVLLSNKKIGIIHADIDIHDWNAFKHDIAQGDYKISGVSSAYANALWGRGRIRQHSAHYDVVENIDEIYLGHTIVKEHTQIDNCHYIDVGSSFTKKLCIVKIQ
ncbi:serine/threonine-protein phosphatase 2 [Acinetobacter lwoffii]|jgi:serine/threonine protein phosphatase 1|uniref:Metallophosphoesterase n=1 Tax=Acinetobacter lwoffii TaxID=28090 RepID=A0A2K8UQK5_ACILW|nr:MULTISPECIES: metallophosphoesterase [Acinetobacter]AUC07537.1 serine/threonine-protein phosphatase 2 [Acinetobacter lwoffii]MDP1315680.1 metallophosphoesterase [Acinetobacter lwoffii]MRA02171.1 serine/threonine-protein phosphatase 2 [Acinetobacter lwoffii]QKU21242.1 metallophosphoesterase [Acinetobacter lwoffii]